MALSIAILAVGSTHTINASEMIELIVDPKTAQAVCDVRQQWLTSRGAGDCILANIAEQSAWLSASSLPIGSSCAPTKRRNLLSSLIDVRENVRSRATECLTNGIVGSCVRYLKLMR